jgi:hypothetical protein
VLVEYRTSEVTCHFSAGEFEKNYGRSNPLADPARLGDDGDRPIPGPQIHSLRPIVLESKQEGGKR